MPTPMRIYAEIAARYGVNAADDAAVDKFFSTHVPSLSPEEQESILSELLDRESNAPAIPGTFEASGAPRAKILMLASGSTSPLALDEEARAVMAMANLGATRFDFELVRSPLASLGELWDRLREHSPTVVHFCGHGPAEAGVLFRDNQNRNVAVETQLLAKLFRGSGTALVVLNGCYSGEQASAIGSVVPSVVGTPAAIDDATARIFVTAFYGALGQGRSVGEAFRNVNAVALMDTRNIFRASGNLDARLVAGPSGVELEQS
jgi:hypothetical protein